MVRTSLSGIAGGVGLILAAVGLADGVKWPLIGLGALLVGASVIGFLWDWLKPKPTPVPSLPATVHTVTSHGQSGGVTAHTVTVGPKPRSFHGYDLTELRDYLEKFEGTSTMMAWGMGDGEAEAFAQEIRALLVNAKWKVDRYRSVMGTPTPPPGISLRFTGPAIGAPDWVAGFRDRLAAMGFAANGVPGFHQTEIYVGRL